jgi:serine/threonine-protein kinase
MYSSPQQAEAALGVAALLVPDPRPTPVPGTDAPAGAEPTQVLPPGAGSYDPNAATTMLPGAGPDADATQAMPHGSGPGGPGADPTRAMPPVPDGPHPWETQLRAARDRNEQTQVQYLDPSQDPLRRRPPRRPAPAPPQGGYGQGGPAPAPYAPPRPQPRPRRYAPPPPPEPAPRREPRRSANPMRIPGLGCLKGCLFTIAILFVAGWLIWEFTPLQGWIAEGKSFWDAASDWISKVSDWVSSLGGPDGTGSGGGTP